MPKTYTTVQGDMWDSIAYKVYGKEYGMDALLKANEPYRDVAISHRASRLLALMSMTMWRASCRRGGGSHV